MDQTVLSDAILGGVNVVGLGSAWLGLGAADRRAKKKRAAAGETTIPIFHDRRTDPQPTLRERSDRALEQAGKRKPV